MGLCLSSSTETPLDVQERHQRRNLHVDGLHAGDTPHPRRPSLNQNQVARRNSSSNSPAKEYLQSINHGIPLRVNISIENLEQLESTDLEIYDQCPTPFPRIESADVDVSDISLSIKKIVIISATVDGLDVTPQIEKLTSEKDSIHIKGGVCTILGINPDKETEVFKISYMHTSDNQIHKKFNKDEDILLCAPEGFELRIIYVSYHGHDYAVIANSLLKNGGTTLSISGGKVEQLFKCPPSKSNISSPFLFTYIYQSPVIHKSCGSTEDFIINPYGLDTPTTIVDEIKSDGTFLF